MNRILSECYRLAVGNGLLPFYEERLRGRKTYRYRAEFECSQWMTQAEIESLQWRKLSALLGHAYNTVPYYRGIMDRAGVRPSEIRSRDDFELLPILDKATVRANEMALISDSFDRSRLIRSATGGSTGEPMQFYYNRDSLDHRVAAAMRGDSWAGWQLCGGEFYLWGATLLPESPVGKYKKGLHHLLVRRSIVDSFRFGDEYLAESVRAYQRMRPRAVVAYANAAYEFARYVKEARKSIPPPVGVITSAEKLYPYQRELIEEVFRAPVFDRYGCREVMMIGAECELHNGLHVTADNVYVEIVRNGRPCAPGEPGEILLTDLHNYGMPLIRYRVGDVGSWKGVGCACGRGLPLLNVVEGRTFDVILTPAGRTVAGEFFPHLMKDFAAIRKYEVIQEKRDLLRIRASLAAPMPPDQLALLKKTIVRTVGTEMRIEWEIGEEVLIEPTRKFRPVTSRLLAESASGSTLQSR